MKNILRYAAIIVVLTAWAFSLGYNYTMARNNSKLSEIISGLNKKLINADRNTHCLKQNYIYSNRYIADSIGTYTGISGSEASLSDSDSVTLVCRISERHCSSCTEYAVSLARETECRNVIYLTDNPHPRSLKNMAQSFGISEDSIFGIHAKLSDADNLIFPYFLFARGGKIKAIYIPFEANDGPDREMVKYMLDKQKQ